MHNHLLSIFYLLFLALAQQQSLVHVLGHFKASPQSHTAHGPIHLYTNEHLEPHSNPTPHEALCEQCVAISVIGALALSLHESVYLLPFMAADYIHLAFILIPPSYSHYQSRAPPVLV